MRLKASFLATASGMTLVLTMVGLLHSTSRHVMDEEPPTDTLSLVTHLLEPVPSPPPTNETPAIGALLEHPDQPDQRTKERLNRWFSVHESLDRVKQLEQLMAGLRTTTTFNQTQQGTQANATHDRAHLAIQKRAHSWAETVTGTLKQQDYAIKKLELALAQKQYKDGEISKTILIQKQTDYQKAAREFKTFLNSFRMAD